MMLRQIENSLADLTPAERRVASFVLKHPRTVTEMTAAQLAQQCAVAPSAVIRFCKSVKLVGFSELKLSLAAELGKRDPDVPAFEEEQGTENVVRKVFFASIQTLKDTLGLLDYDTISAMAEALAKANRIFLFGIGTSAVIASDAQYRLSQLGLPAAACTDVLLMNVTAANLEPGDLVLAVSHSGRTKAVVDAVRRAKESGAVTLGITSFQTSPLYLDCDLAACVFADELNYPVEAVSARVAHFCLLDGLTMILATGNFDQFTDRIKVRNIILEGLRY